LGTVNTFAVYQEAKARIAAKTHDIKDEVIVALWDVTTQATAMAANKALEADAARKTVAEYAHQNELLASRLAGQASKAVN